jgi:hypothetical protein
MPTDGRKETKKRFSRLHERASAGVNISGIYNGLTQYYKV